jgi:hypothetical protein
MLWYCAYTWHHGTTAQQVRTRVVQQHDAGTNKPDKIRGWYDIVGGGAGFLLLETNDPQEVNDLLQPYMDLMSWDVRAVNTLDYRSAIDRFRQMPQARQQPAGVR